ncbi:MAG: imidazole glycerol phosphate synthase subunit HisH, partial [Alphaproteobacteria bacterium]
VVTSDAAAIKKADRVIVPGVGAAAPAMKQLQNKRLIDTLRNLTQPVLGICLGMQLLYDRSTEGKGTDCLGILPGSINVIPASKNTPVPHMGWNQIKILKSDHPLLHQVEDNSFVYFVHSFAAPLSGITLASTEYGLSFTAMVGQKNVMGCQFHPERSGQVGQQILKNFMSF